MVFYASAAHLLFYIFIRGKRRDATPVITGNAAAASTRQARSYLDITRDK
jgi:hypothetical protein